MRSTMHRWSGNDGGRCGRAGRPGGGPYRGAGPGRHENVRDAAPLRGRAAGGAGLEEGPGTIDAVCSADLDPERSAVANSARALLLEVGAEAVADGAAKTVSELAQGYGEVSFKEELPESICGESDKARVKIDNVKQVLEDARVVYTADVVCAEVKFLQIGVRRASVRFLIAPDVRYRLVARAPSEDYESQKATIEAFFSSFRVLPTGR